MSLTKQPLKKKLAVTIAAVGLSAAPLAPVMAQSAAPTETPEATAPVEAPAQATAS